MSIDSLIELVASDFERMDARIHNSIDSQVPLVFNVAKHVVDAGGKRMRPLMCLLAAKACTNGAQVNDHIIALSCVIEMLHTATLVHDDVVDESDLRRGIATANATWNNATAVLVGDFLIARSFDLLVDLQSLPLLKLFSTGTCSIAEGEVLQLQCQHNPDITEATYFEMIHGKTSRLFEIACESPALLVGSEYCNALRSFASHFGNAFQVVDDILDYVGDAAVLGKNIGDDLMEGKPTLPVIATLQRVQGDDLARIRQSIIKGSIGDINYLIDCVKTSGGLEYCYQVVRQQSQLAIDALATLPDNQYKKALISLTKLAVERIA